ncbi:MAG: TIGR03086 family metal-binding protein [Actinomycetota bacterium]
MSGAPDNLPPDVVELYVDALATFGEAVRDVADHEWDLPTPSTEWNVREVVAHVVLGEAHLPVILAGDTTTTSTGFDVELLGPTPLTTWRGTALRAIDAAREPGVVDRSYELDLGAVSGRQLLSYRITDNVVHAWDVSVGVGRPAPIKDVHAEFLLEFWLPVALDLGESTFFAKPTDPVSDSPSDRLLALLGRTPPNLD